MISIEGAWDVRDLNVSLGQQNEGGTHFPTIAAFSFSNHKYGQVPIYIWVDWRAQEQIWVFGATNSNAVTLLIIMCF